MKFISISLISRLVLLLVFPAMALAAQGDTNILNKRETGLVAIEEGKIKNLYLNEHSTQLSISSYVLKNQFEPESDKSKLSAYNRKVKSFSTVSALNKSEKTIEILATGYSSTPDQCWGDPFITASGTRVHKGTIACPLQYPFGTKVKIDSMGTFTCEDRGGAIKGNHFDIWFETRAEALQWGKRTVIAQIIYQ